jgi:hypothetical protein
MTFCTDKVLVVSLFNNSVFKFQESRYCIDVVHISYFVIREEKNSYFYPVVGFISLYCNEHGSSSGQVIIFKFS